MQKQLKYSIYSLTSLILSVVYYITISNLFIGNGWTEQINNYILGVTNYKFYNFALYVEYCIFLVLPLILLLLSIWFGTKSLRIGDKIGSKLRIFNIVSITISAFMLFTMSVATFFGF